jgi:4-hydroxy-tetrahydrodipicolinate synthase
MAAKQAPFGRVLTAMVTPMTPTLAVDYERAGKLARALLASGSDALVLSGTTGECPSLTIDEQVRLWEAVREAVGPSAKLIAGASTNSTSESLHMVRQGEPAGMDGLMLTVPYYNKPPQEGLVRHFTVLAEATSLPCILYNIPGRTSLNMTAETTLRLAQVPNIVGVKEASGDLEQVRRILAGAPDGFWVWSGDDPQARTMVEVGGWGVISVASHLVGLQIQEMLHAQATGDADTAKAIEERLRPLFSVLFIETNPIPVKWALREAGFDVGGLRLPMIEASEQAQAAIRAELARHRIDLPVGPVPV